MSVVKILKPYASLSSSAAVAFLCMVVKRQPPRNSHWESETCVA